jgi:alkanesulfonate monooxygenase SsuD/methylene tetrahydromethanopterin reductase-like flavin-dependent oxidoreductase (luciferase family)
MLEIAAELDRRGFPGIACPSLGASLALCVSLAHRTTRIAISTAIQPIYLATAAEVAGTAAHVHEVSGGRFTLGLGVSHAPVVGRLGVEVGKPLADVERYVAALRAAERFSGPLPPIHLATLRDKMLDLAARIADGAIWANASRAAIGRQVAIARARRGDDFPLTNMVPTVVDADLDAARAVHRRTLTSYATLPNYRNYWRDAGHAEQVDAFEEVLATASREEQNDALRSVMRDEWIDDCTISGPADAVRAAVGSWREVGVEPIVVMSSTRGGQAVAIGELMDVYGS